jgi:hypothetical protein
MDVRDLFRFSAIEFSIQSAAAPPLPRIRRLQAAMKSAAIHKVTSQA